MNKDMQAHQAIRFDPDPGNHAWICMNSEPRHYRPQIRAEIIDESHSGCGLAVYNSTENAEALRPGQRCLTQVGRLDPMPATIIWRRVEGDQTALRIGLRFDS